MKRIVSAILCCLLLTALLPLAASADTTVKGIYFAMDYPEAGKEPIQTATWLSEGYSIHSIEWHDDNTGKYLEPGDKIVSGHSYTATLWVEADSGYSFNCANDNTPTVTAYVNGEKYEVYKAFEYKAWAMVCVDVYFSRVPSKGWIKSAAISVPAPVAGEKPSYDKLYGANCYSGNVYFSGNTDENMINGVSWYYVGGGELTPATAVFSPNTAYQVHFLLFTDEGYRFTRNASVTVNGQTAKAMLDYDTFLSVSYDFPATGSGHSHTPSGWRTTGAYHYTACTECGEFLEQEDHKGGTATCTEDGKCTVCGYAYLKANDHKWSPTWLYQDKTGHAWICADCKANSPIQPHTPGSEATETAPQTCTDCGYILAPAKNHTHDLSHVPEVAADCVNEGNIEYWYCTGCNDCFTDAQAKNKLPEAKSVKVGALGHQASNSWHMDKSLHWRTCSRCNAALEETKMAHEGTVCATCGYKTDTAPTSPTTTTAPATTEPTTTAPATTKPTTTEPTATTPASHEEGPKGTGWMLPVLVALVSFGAAITAAVIILKKRKGANT